MSKKSKKLKKDGLFTFWYNSFEEVQSWLLVNGWWSECDIDNKDPAQTLISGLERKKRQFDMMFSALKDISQRKTTVAAIYPEIVEYAGDVVANVENIEEHARQSSIERVVKDTLQTNGGDSDSMAKIIVESLQEAGFEIKPKHSPKTVLNEEGDVITEEYGRPHYE